MKARELKSITRYPDVFLCFFFRVFFKAWFRSFCDNVLYVWFLHLNEMPNIGLSFFFSILLALMTETNSKFNETSLKLHDLFCCIRHSPDETKKLIMNDRLLIRKSHELLSSIKIGVLLIRHIYQLYLAEMRWNW